MKITQETAKPCEITIQEGMINSETLPNGLMVIDYTVSKEYPDLVRDPYLVMGRDERSKTMETYGEILRSVGNEERIVAVGGGVTTDVAGFAAATYRRGIGLVNIPTTLLGMVDASIGGKNGVNFMGIKNQVGTIYQPDGVLIDPLFLKTLHEDYFRSGVAEIVKYSLLFDTPNFARVKKGIRPQDSDLVDIITMCCQAKVSVVEEDEQDKGSRHKLNLGHTFGHAFEIEGQIGHGYGIAMGMVSEARLALQQGIVDSDYVEKVVELLQPNNLPTEIIGPYSIERLLENMKADKKGAFTFVFDKDHCNVQLDEQTVRKFLEERI